MRPLSELVPRALRGDPSERGHPHRSVRVSAVPVHRGRHDGPHAAHRQGLRGAEENTALLTGTERNNVCPAVAVQSKAAQLILSFSQITTWFSAIFKLQEEQYLIKKNPCLTEINIRIKLTQLFLYLCFRLFKIYIQTQEVRSKNVQ